MMKEYLGTLQENKKLYKDIKDVFIQVLCDSKFNRMNILNIKLSTSKWRRIKNRLVLQTAGRKP